MKTKRALSLLVAVFLLISLLPMSVFAAGDQTSTAAGVKIVEKNYDSANHIMTIAVQAKLPSGANGIISGGVILSFDSSKLTLMHKTNATTYAATETATARNTAVDVKLTNTDEEVYTLAETKLYGKDGRAAYYAAFMEMSGVDPAETGTDWYDMFTLRFSVDGDADSVLNSESIRIATAEKDDALIKAVFPANNDYAITINTADGSYYKFGRMSSYAGGDLSGSDYLMAATDNATATFTGSTNLPPKPALTGTPTISGTAQVGQTLTAGVSGLNDTTNISYQWCANDTAISGATAATYALTADEAGKTITVKVTATGASSYSGTVTSAATGAVANAAQSAPSITSSDITATTDTTITVTANAAWEYSKDNGANWQASNVFTGLTPDTTYDQICVRLAAKTGYDASPASTAISGQTQKATISDSAKGTLAGYTGTYDGSAHDAVAGAAEAGYTVTYSTTSASSGFSGTMPKVTNVSDSKTVWVKLSKTGYADKVFELTATVNAKNISGVTINLGTQNTYTGSAQAVVITSVMDGTTPLTSGTNYTITSGGTATNVENTTLTISGSGNYAGNATTTWSLVAKSVTASMIASVSDQAYTGSAITPKPDVTDGSVLTEITDFTYGYENNTYVGTAATVKITGTGNYTGIASKTFNITAVAQTPTITATATVAKGGNTVDLKPLVTGAQGDVSFAISGTDLGCSITDGVLTSGATTGDVKITVNITAKDVDSDGTDEYIAYTETDAITVTVQDKATDTLAGVAQSGCTYGETLADPTYTAPSGTVSTTITYAGTLRSGSTYAASTTKPTEAGTYTVTVKCETSDTIYTSAPVSFTIAPKSITGAAVTLGTALTYTGSSQTQTVSAVNLGGTDITAYCDISGNTATNAGSQNLTVTAKADSNYTGTTTKEFTIAKKSITPTIDVTGSYKFTGSAITPTYTVKDGSTALASTDYTATVSNNINAGSGTITVTANNGNYTFTETQQNFTIAKADAPTLTDLPMSQKYSVTTGENAIGAAGMPSDAGTLTYAMGSESTTGSVSVSTWDVDSTGNVTFTLSGGAAGDTVTLPVIITSENYATTTVNVVITLTAKDAQAALTLTGSTNVVYGQTLTLGSSGGSGTGAVTYVVTAGTGDATVTGNVLTPTTAGTVTVKAVKAADADYNQAESAPVTITIDKATPTGTPAYAKITASGKTLADAALTAGTIAPAGGTIVWDLGDAQEVSANTSYNWTYTPADTANYNNLTGSITPYKVSTGGVEPTSYAITVEEAEHGSVSADVKTAASGKTVTLTVTPDKGYTLETITATDKGGKEIELTIVKASESYTFKMPAGAVTVKATFMEDNTMLNFFVDVPADAYYYDAVLWAVKEGITSGVDAVHFDPNGTCTRAQAVTFLWRAAGCPEVEVGDTFTDVVKGSYYEKAVSWALANGITSGTSATTFSPDADCTRAQIVTFLHRANKVDTLNIKNNPFNDVKDGAYYYNAVLWAAENDITSGTSATTFSPDANCTRAQIVTFLYRYMGK